MQVLTVAYAQVGSGRQEHITAPLPDADDGPIIGNARWNAGLVKKRIALVRHRGAHIQAAGDLCQAIALNGRREVTLANSGFTQSALHPEHALGGWPERQQEHEANEKKPLQ